jgi:threonine/homoserine/homoserine lactone efflux protein
MLKLMSVIREKEMIPVETFLTFFLASLLLALAPGPDNIFVLTQSSLYGKRSGLIVMLGLCTGLVVHSFAVALGVAVIFQQSALAFSALKMAGAGYLLYLAWQAFRASATKIQGKGSGEIRLVKLYGRGIIMNITNPKVSIFFLAFLPQFADPERGPVWLQILMLGGLFIFSTILVFGGIAMLAGTIGQWVNRSDRAQKIMNRVAGTVFIGLALKLATTER